MSIDKAISNVSNVSSIDQVALSPSAAQVIYRLSRKYNPSGAPSTSSLWISLVAPGSKSRQLTSGEHDDSCATWSADESKVYFLSNRHKQDGKPGPAAIWAIPLKEGGEVYAISSTESKSPIGSFWLSPDGQHIAYTTERDATDEEKRKEAEKDDAIVFDDNDERQNAQLWLLGIATRQPRRLTLGAKDGWHVVTVAWSPDSKELMVLSKMDSSFDASPVAMLRLSAFRAENQVEEVYTLPLLCSPVLRWPSMDEVALIQGYLPEEIISSSTLYFRSTRPDSLRTSKEDTGKRYYGDVEDIFRIVDVHDGKTIAPAVMFGVNTRIDLIQSSGDKKTLWMPNDEATSNEYDVRVNGNGDYVLAMVVRSGFRFEPPELWAGTISASKLEAGATLKLTDKLSTHHNWMADVPALVTEVIRYEADDGIQLEGVLTWPRDKERKAMPTVLFPHGGPYWRNPPSLELSVYGGEALAFAGYLVLYPQYRGGAGRGHAFANALQGSLGTTDWPDCWALLQYAVQQGWADKDRLGIAGWSMGGYLTACGVTQTKDVFKAAMVGCGICDWGAQVASSDALDQPLAIVGSAPWSERRVDINCSPISHVKGVKTPVLILHGEEDKRVPTAQGIEFYRGLRRASGYPKNHKLVIYPREGHM
ncbi:alpha/beta-hydrolase [Calocera cornea HHB12733]|uniref:Dipeptidyl-peptidase V n=1 Tax=Calocera cornea HHB12733 TaxID=1353952 RepID=A0A165GC24_9BASI|nr:alpha/beta-hydrolase [Calocera cornea HHB12733]